MKKENQLTINLYGRINLIQALKEIKESGYKLSKLTEIALTEYIKEKRPDLAEKFDL